MKLNKEILRSLRNEVVKTPSEAYVHLPTRVIQFGTGVLLRGLPDYFIHQANEKNIFNGRIVVIKSTAVGQTDAFEEQDGLYTHCIEGIKDGKQVQAYFINSAISKVLTASTDWQHILELAEQKEINIIISNVTEAGFVANHTDRIDGDMPNSFPGKLLAILYKRYLHFNGALDAGYVILPTELIPDNGVKLLEMVQQLAANNSLPLLFIDWVRDANDFCNTLVDRIVPGKLPEDRQLEVNTVLGYEDSLMIVSEPYALWAIESDRAKTKAMLSFANQPGILVAPSILKYRELKLRLLNGTHTFSCSIACLLGFATVKDAMQDPLFFSYIKKLMYQEIIPCMVGDDISMDEATVFSDSVIDRFKNPYLAHRWESIIVDVDAKMKTRNIPLIEKSLVISEEPHLLMAIGYAAFLIYTGLYKNGEAKNKNACFNWDNSAVDHASFENQVLTYASIIENEGIGQLLEELVLTKQIANEE